ncbi:MAG: hypothetical protein BWY47_01404 [Bacteroidetes bacterium ADurb.Bin302]|nr:MAG: hypothetical protein BWY47_01404 [Bacteroidetes bacterium ADurb.Bin302]
MIKEVGVFLNNQLEWVKSFFSEQKLVNGKVILKGSSRRTSIYVLVYTFAVNYTSVQKEVGILPDIPYMWAIFLGFVIGLNIFDLYVRNKVSSSISEIKDKTDGSKDN